jgi:hypothetical protein
MTLLPSPLLLPSLTAYAGELAFFASCCKIKIKAITANKPQSNGKIGPRIYMVCTLYCSVPVIMPEMSPDVAASARNTINGFIDGGATTFWRKRQHYKQ